MEIYRGNLSSSTGVSRGTAPGVQANFIIQRGERFAKAISRDFEIWTSKRELAQKFQYYSDAEDILAETNTRAKIVLYIDKKPNNEIVVQPNVEHEREPESVFARNFEKPAEPICPNHGAYLSMVDFMIFQNCEAGEIDPGPLPDEF
jgi:hypothetical protein